MAVRVAAILDERRPAPEPVSPYMTIPEAAEYLRCSRQRIDDLLSQRRLTRFKDGARTLVSRAELEAHLRGERAPGVVTSLSPAPGSRTNRPVRR